MPADNKQLFGFYDAMTPEIYDSFMGAVNYTEPAEIVKTVVQIGIPANARVLDVGAGTGLIGELLTKEGYSDLEAMDASKELLKSLDAKKIYKSSTLAFFGYGDYPKEE